MLLSDFLTLLMLLCLQMMLVKLMLLLQLLQPLRIPVSAACSAVAFPACEAVAASAAAPRSRWTVTDAAAVGAGWNGLSWADHPAKLHSS